MYCDPSFLLVGSLVRWHPSNGCTGWQAAGGGRVLNRRATGVRVGVTIALALQAPGGGNLRRKSAFSSLNLSLLYYRFYYFNVRGGILSLQPVSCFPYRNRQQ